MPIVVKNTNNLEFQYQEPTTSVNGTALNDLKETRVYMRALPDGIESVVKIEPASAPTGGGNVIVAVTAPVLPDEEKIMEGWVVAVDNVGNVGPKSNIIQVEVDRLAPSAPLL